ncbi:hypothetical protein ACWGI8_11360 [Streptomyces sp. NPDC054841]
MYAHTSPELIERWWSAEPARTAFDITGITHAPDRFTERLGTEPGLWIAAVALTASDFPGSLAELVDAAQELDRDGELPNAPDWTSIDRPVDRLLSWAPAPAVDRIVLWTGPQGRRLLAEQTTYCSQTARALIRHGDLAIRQELAKDREPRDPRDAGYPPRPDAGIVQALLELDDPETNLWLVQAERLTSRVKFDVLVGRPFAPGRTEPVPRLPRTRELAERLAEIIDPRELARRFDAPDPEHVLLALCATRPPATAQTPWASLLPESALMTPYQQLVSALLLARAERTDLLKKALAAAPLDRNQRDWFRLALNGQESPAAVFQRAVLLTQQSEGFFEEARRALFSRHRGRIGTARWNRPDRLLAHGRALAEDPWYPLDWDEARRMAADPANFNQRGLPSFSLTGLVEHAGCPRDLVRLLAHEETAKEHVFLHLFRQRSEGLDLLRSMPLTEDTAAFAFWAAVRDGDWHPEVTIQDVLRHGRPARILAKGWSEPFAYRYAEYVRVAVRAAWDDLLSGLSAQQRATMEERLPAFEGTLPELLSSL